MAGGRQLRGKSLWLMAAGVLTAVLLVVCMNVGIVTWYVSSHSGGPLTPQMQAGPVDRRRFLRDRGRGAPAANAGLSSADTQDGEDDPSAGEAQWPLFWVLTAPAYEWTRCREVATSWGRLVPPDSLLFLGAGQNSTTPEGYRFVVLPAPPTNKSLKEFLAWRFVARAFPERKWYVKGDDDTFFVVGNLNRYLEEFDPRLPYFLGCKFHLGGAGGVQYVSGGAGYALSAAAVQRLVPVLPHCLRKFGSVGEGDLAVGQCLQAAGVAPEDTRDPWGRQRFHAFTFGTHAGWLRSRQNMRTFWYHRWLWGQAVEGGDCCGVDTSVSFHYMAGRMRSFRWPLSPGAAAAAVEEVAPAELLT